MERTRPDDVFLLPAFFQGSWRLQRRMRDDIQAVSGTAHGRCVFHPAGDGILQYREEGRLLLDGAAAPLGFRRAFLYTFADEVVSVAFDDGDRIGLHYQAYRRKGNALVPVGPHQCGADAYSAHYRLLGENEFEMETTIDGPSKKSRLYTRFTREEAA
ncbi:MULTISPECIES: DUF6314 family protein [unclassified Herbaspirillum]|uniref:DUF6314 family protein n=1 Tax=unclassified Herbaspirillum TaxID=2624150 RepID=UPI001154ACD0|nr:MULTISPECIES: DUF6314 family protein [unclassified Herbaspirillum]MBB5393109.1 hypothetical protein [Herbaspirillum sp. SJZ102]TQK04249.1 hypothetical protein FB599_2800 [Herbaspirillum sp. SJZ130]TQK09966.1 hypothetical protein FB598_2962 [Herbaspirillum sp. SJZ106]TWC65711.1 hypothetical protein FB597_10617 [Herbaspirillum sp. SJZ099]